MWPNFKTNPDVDRVSLKVRAKFSYFVTRHVRASWLSSTHRVLKETLALLPNRLSSSGHDASLVKTTSGNQVTSGTEAVGEVILVP